MTTHILVGSAKVLEGVPGSGVMTMEVVLRHGRADWEPGPYQTTFEAIVTRTRLARPVTYRVEGLSVVESTAHLGTLAWKVGYAKRGKMVAHGVDRSAYRSLHALLVWELETELGSRVLIDSEVVYAAFDGI